MSKHLRVAVAGVIAALVLSVTGVAGAAHWPGFGGDGGRSGYQPILEGGLPVDERWVKPIVPAPKSGVRTSPVVSAGEPVDQRVIVGTDDGRIHLYRLLSGTRVGPDGGVDVSEHAWPFGSGAGSVSFVETSSASGLGQVFAVHNDSARIEIAQIDEASGTLVGQTPVVGSDGYIIETSALLTGSGGTRVLWFLAAKGADTRLFRVAITNATSPGAVIAPATMSPGSILASTLSSPTLVYLDVGGATPYIAVGGIDGWIRTYSTGDGITAGPAGVIASGSSVHTPSVPVTSNGAVPMPAPALYAAATRQLASPPAPADEFTTNAYRVIQSAGDAMVLEANLTSPTLAGRAAPALATNVGAGIPSDAAGRVFVTTGANLFVLSAVDLTVSAKLSPTDDLQASSTGFSYTTAMASGDLLFAARDNGSQLVMTAANATPVAATEFAQANENAGSSRSFGQPAFTSRFAVFASDRGVFTYRSAAGGPPKGYWQIGSDGGVFAFGTAGFHGSLGDIALNKPIVAMGTTTTGTGYWLAASDGGIFAFGSARFFGSTGDIKLNSPVVGFVPTPSDRGYWLVAADGGVFAFGDAGFFGSTGGIKLNKPIVAVAATPTGNGYWLIASDGGVFAFGDARFLGSTGNIALNKPVVAAAAMTNGKGYWLIASDGGVFAFGAATFHGSTGAINLNAPIVSMASSPSNAGYLLTASDGGLFAFGDAPFLGAAAQFGPLNKPIVAMAVR
ncbi:MAG: hypothetical protein ACR2H3_07930 [Acidimicrobiales bacterium]